MPDIDAKDPLVSQTAARGHTTGFAHADRVTRYWTSLRRSAGMIPERRALDPREIAPALAHVFIAELMTPRVARLRLAGGHLHDLMGMDVRGMPLTVFLAPQARDEVMRALAHVAQGGRVQIPLAAERGLGRPAMDGMLALMPLLGYGGRIDRVLGVLDTLGPLGRAPRRFKLREGASLAPETVTLPRPDRPLFDALRRITDVQPDTPSRAPLSVITHEAEPAGPSPARRERVALRVIEGGRDD